MDESPQQPSQAQADRQKGSTLAWIFVIIFLLTTVAGFGLYAMSKQQVKDAQSAQAEAQKKLTATETKLKAADTKLSTATFLPKEMSPQCSTANNDATRLAPVNTSPIDGYNVYLVNCVNDLVAGRTNTGKVIAFKVAENGTQTFVFGAGSGEPYCISSKILGNVTAATDISKSTGLPICKTF